MLQWHRGGRLPSVSVTSVSCSPRGPGQLRWGRDELPADVGHLDPGAGLGTGNFPGRRGEQKGAGGAEASHTCSSESFSRDPASAKVNAFNTLCTRFASY